MKVGQKMKVSQKMEVGKNTYSLGKIWMNSFGNISKEFYQRILLEYFQKNFFMKIIQRILLEYFQKNFYENYTTNGEGGG